MQFQFIPINANRCRSDDKVPGTLYMRCGGRRGLGGVGTYAPRREMIFWRKAKPNQRIIQPAKTQKKVDLGRVFQI